MHKWILILAVLVAGAFTGPGVLAADEKPLKLTLAPAEIKLSGPRSMPQLLVSATFPDGKEADLTRSITYLSSNPAAAVVSKDGVVQPCGDGETTIAVRQAGLEAKTRIHVSGFRQKAPIDFRTEIVAALARGGCNQGACHGSPQGKNGFRLSLRGFDPALDYVNLTREALGRRINRAAPEQSLLLGKANGSILHQGGVRFQKDEPAYQMLLNWVQEGGRNAEKPVSLQRLEILPGRRSLHTSSPKQQMVARAHYSDGLVRDVTQLAVFTTSNEAAAKVSANGLVEFQESAEVAVLVRYLDEIVSAPLSYVRRDPAYVYRAPPAVNYVDKLVFAKHQELHLTPSAIASDEVFLRRVYLDAIGVLPTPEEARSFLDSKEPRKRARLIDRLLERDEFAAFWALKWADIMQGNREMITERGVHGFHRYLVRAFAEDRPLSQFAREILTSRGNTIHHPPANFYRISRSPEDTAEAMAQLFLGVRIQCAKCHNHPYEAILQRHYYEFAAYFARVRHKGIRIGLDDEIIYLSDDGEVKHPVTGKPVSPGAFGEPAGTLDPDEDRRTRLADWLTKPANPYFARSIVNRIWYHLLGRGLVEPIDDFRDSNPPANAELLDALAEDFARGGYRVKRMIRTILNSSTYQLSAVPAAQRSKDEANPEKYFTAALVKLLTAEQILDAISSATGVPEIFKGYPPGTRAMELAEGAVDHNFLKAFAKPVRDTTCDCARETEPSLNQVIHLINNPELLAKLNSPKNYLARCLKDGKSVPDAIEELYLAALSRRPSQTERELTLKYIQKLGDTTAGLRDLQQALINTNEFLLRH